MSWYRKYRPQQIKDLNLVKVRDIFSSMLKDGKIPQSLLFAGPKGTGKTSSSRIIGALLNDEANFDLVDQVYFNKKSSKKSFHEPDPNTDFAQKVYKGHSYVVQEMDAASNRGIDDIRSLKERVMLPPQEGRMSVYILDEAHMLTTEAFNALLKILEEPPAHVIFILATTELHKIPPTIASRCTTITFYKASEEEIIEALDRIVKSEKIKIDKKSLEAIANYADGSFRDAVKLLELTCQSGNFSLEALETVIGSSLESQIKQIIQSVLDKDKEKLVNLIKELRDTNTDQKFFYKSLFEFLHNNLLRSLGVEEGESFSSQQVLRFLLNQLMEANLESPSPISFLSLELKLLEIISRAKKKTSGGNKGGEEVKKNDKKVEKKSSLVKKPLKKDLKVEVEKAEEIIFMDDKEIDSVLNESKEEDLTGISYSKLLFDKWGEFLEAVNSENSSLAALLHSSKPLEGVNGLAKVGVYYRFHQEQLQLPRFTDIIEKCSMDLVGKRVKFDFLLQEAPSDATLVQLDREMEEKVLARVEMEKKMDQQVEKRPSKESVQSTLSAMATDALM